MWKVIRNLELSGLSKFKKLGDVLTIGKKLSATILAVAIAGGASLGLASSASADASGSRACPGGATNYTKVFSYSTKQVIHQQRWTVNNAAYTRTSPPGPTNFETTSPWNSVNWYISGPASSASSYCSF